MNFAYAVPAPMGPEVVRVVARNPSPFTFKGTNTYLVGTESLAVIDPGPDLDEHRAAILAAAAGRPITHILTTHAHRDHIDGAGELAAVTGAETCAYPRTSTATDLDAIGPSGKASINADFTPDRALADGDSIEGEGWTLKALHTPGHAPDHLCFALEGRRILFSGDHVMGWSTTVIAPPEGRMADYLDSLERLLGRNDRLFLPSHGGRIEEPVRTVKAYLIHRRWREQSILDAIQNGTDSVRALVPIVYDGIPRELAGAAALSVLAHVEHLIHCGFVACDGPADLDRPLVAL